MIEYVGIFLALGCAYIAARAITLNRPVDTEASKPHLSIRGEYVIAED